MENFDKFWFLLPKKDADTYFVSIDNVECDLIPLNFVH